MTGPAAPRRFSLVFLIAVLFPVLATLARAAPGDPEAQPWKPKSRPKADIEFKIATLAPAGSIPMNTLTELDNEVREKTGGKVGFKIFPGGQAGEEKEVVEKIEAGQLHGGAFIGVGLGYFLPAARVLEIPFFFHNYEECDVAAAAVERRIGKMFEDEGWMELGRSEQGFVYIFSARPIGSAADMKKSQMSLLVDDLNGKLTMEVMGFSPEPQRVNDVLTALSAGLKDTVYISPAYAIALGWNTKMKFVMDLPVVNGVASLVVRKAAFERIPVDLRPAVLEITRRHMAKLITLTREEAAEATQTMRKLGIKPAEVTEEERRNFEKVGAEVRERLPAVLYPADPGKQEEVRGLLSAIVKAVEGRRSAAAKPGP